MEYPEEVREKFRLAKDIFCEVYNVHPNALSKVMQRKVANAKKALSYFYYNEMGLTLEETAEAVGIDFSTIHYHVSGKGAHDNHYITDKEYRENYLEARYRYYKKISENVLTDGSTD